MLFLSNKRINKRQTNKRIKQTTFKFGSFWFRYRNQNGWMQQDPSRLLLQHLGSCSLFQSSFSSGRMYITLRNFVTSTSPDSVTQNLSKEAELEKQIVQDSAKIKILEDKLAHAEEELYKASNIFKDQKGNLTDEIKILKVSLRKSQAESS